MKKRKKELSVDSAVKGFWVAYLSQPNAISTKSNIHYSNVFPCGKRLLIMESWNHAASFTPRPLLAIQKILNYLSARGRELQWIS